MKKNYSYYLTLIAIPFIALALLSLSGGRDGQYSGSPGDGGATCTACHSGGSFGAVAQITTNIPGTGFIYGDTYEITVTATSSATKHGFQLTTEDLSDTKVGTYTAGTGNQIVNSGSHMTHTQAGNQQTSWTFDWTAPTTAEGGEITFYASVNATDSQNNTSGDEVVTASRSFSVNSIGIDENELITFSVYPNPTTDYLSLQYDESTLQNADLVITNYNGQVVFNSNTLTDRIDVSNLNSGVYILQITSENKTGFSRFIKE